ncbi:unnamed protein product [Rotaria socialis]|uniref:EF-hand domain-containing protein n=1 Tax=Rotaria socialis TaxID=392032 RepID=A0A818CRV8_9BILA|nr:unnamed protein product [Rotaria socialis]CAF3430522.1 unnamed protein product [Rotaria socialis]CAF3443690.1 unnamed protein product [Rotaria socialis]CAF4110756.1 unnamed protein product [Rotaria socialis]CAF4187288.1 unnamed protein product [Rotaria socialis]
MKALSIELLHLFLLNIFVLNALPVLDVKSGNQNSIKSSDKKAVLLQSHINNLTSVLNISLVLPKIQLPENFNLTEVAKNLKDFGIHSLKDDKHIEGVPLDRHGKVNPDFHKEIFLGNHELFESDIQHDENKRNKKLEEIFREVDLDHNERLSQDELFNYVYKNVQQHLNEARDRNLQLFLLIDSNEDGIVMWHEYVALYIKFHNMSALNIQDLNNINNILDMAEPSLHRELVNIHYRWIQVDDDGDNKLNAEEFLEFRHPEVFGRLYKYMVEDLMALLDRNGDKKIGKNEFFFVSPNILLDKGDSAWENMNRKWIEEQKEEFREMDLDKDDFLTADELSQAFNPLNRVHIGMQVKKLFSLVDDSPKDDVLSLEEIKTHVDVFTNINILDTEKVLHGNT